MTTHLSRRPSGRRAFLHARANRAECVLQALTLVLLAPFVPALLLLLVPVALRRLHDIGVSNRWAALLALSGPIGWLTLLWLITLPGDSGPNPYGSPTAQVSRTTSLCTITSACG